MVFSGFVVVVFVRFLVSVVFCSWLCFQMLLWLLVVRGCLLIVASHVVDRCLFDIVIVLLCCLCFVLFLWCCLVCCLVSMIGFVFGVLGVSLFVI